MVGIVGQGGSSSGSSLEEIIAVKISGVFFLYWTTNG